MTRCFKFDGVRHEIAKGDPLYPEAFLSIRRPPDTLYVIGNPDALQEGLAVVGARKATPYGISCARHFAGYAAKRGISIISGGARGCDAAAHEAAIACGGSTVVFLGGGCDFPYPEENVPLFKRVIESGGAIVSENAWDSPPKRFYFRERNRLIAGLAKATLIVEAGLPSGTFSTADEALECSREVLVIPGSITSAQSLGANRLIYQGATPIVDDESFGDQLFGIYGIMKTNDLCCFEVAGDRGSDAREKILLKALDAEQKTPDELVSILSLGSSGASGQECAKWVMGWLSEMVREGRIGRYPNGRFGPCVRP